MRKIKTIFIGSGSFAVPILHALSKSELIELVAVITQPDRPAGRKQELTGSEVKQGVVKLAPELPVLTPDKLRNEAGEILEQYKPELIVVADYGQIIPDLMLDAPRYKCLNVHGSLLPKLRGAVPIPMAILQGVTKTGITIPVMTPGLDDGPIIARAEAEVLADDTTESLKQRLADLGASELLRMLPGWIAGDIAPLEQDHSAATFCYQKDIAKERAEIIFDTDVELAERMVRAFDPWPIAWVKLDGDNAAGKRLKIFKAKIADNLIKNDKLAITREGKRLLLQLHAGRLELLEVQLEGKQKLSASEYLFLAK